MRKFYLVLLILFSVQLSAYSRDLTEKNDENVTITCNDTVDMEKLISAIMYVESKNVENSISNDGTCVGIMQIKKIVVDDCNEYLKMKKNKKRYTYNDRLNKEKSIEMFYLIQERYKNYKRSRCDSDIEHMIRVWNGGCNYKKNKTQDYYLKVMKIYNMK